MEIICSVPWWIPLCFFLPRILNSWKRLHEPQSFSAGPFVSLSTWYFAFLQSRRLLTTQRKEETIQDLLQYKIENWEEITASVVCQNLRVEFWKNGTVTTSTQSRKRTPARKYITFLPSNHCPHFALRVFWSILVSHRNESYAARNSECGN